MATAFEIRKSQRSGIAIFKWSLLTPFFLLLLFLLPVFLLQIYFSFHSWSVYLSTWWEADFVGFDTFAEVLSDPRFHWSILRSLIFAGVFAALERHALPSGMAWPSGLADCRPDFGATGGNPDGRLSAAADLERLLSGRRCYGRWPELGPL